MPEPCPISEVLAIGVPTLRHVPREVRPALQQALASALRDFLVHKDSLSLWPLLALPKLLLRATGDPKSHPGLTTGGVVKRRLDLWGRGDYGALWKETMADLPRATRKRQSPSKAEAKQHDSKLVVCRPLGLFPKHGLKKFQ